MDYFSTTLLTVLTCSGNVLVFDEPPPPGELASLPTGVKDVLKWFRHDDLAETGCLTHLMVLHWHRMNVLITHQRIEIRLKSVRMSARCNTVWGINQRGLDSAI
jgi:hypothetical protein